MMSRIYTSLLEFCKTILSGPRTISVSTPKSQHGNPPVSRTSEQLSSENFHSLTKLPPQEHAFSNLSGTPSHPLAHYRTM